MSRKMPLKEDTARVLEYLRAYTTEHTGLAPSVREIAQGCFMAASQVLTQLEILEAHGIIARSPGRARALWLLDEENEP